MSRKLIAFDFDGTLVESHIGYTQALKEFSEARGLPWDSMKMAKGYVDPWKYDLGWGLPLEQQVPVFEALNEFYFSEMNTANRFMPTLFENALETLESLTADYDMVVVTARERKSLHKVMDYYGLSRYFPYVRTKCCAFERGYAIKPAPDALLCVLKDTKHAATDVVMVGDTCSDIQMAHSAGTRSIAAMWGVHDHERLSQQNPTVLLENIAGLPEAIKQAFSR